MYLATVLPTVERLSLRKKVIVTAGHNKIVSPLLAIYEPTRATLLFQDLGHGALGVN